MICPNRVSANSDEIVTQVVPVRNINATQLVPILRPLMPQQAHLVGSQAGNALILSDRASNVNRIIRIIQRIDQAGDEEVDVVRLENASAARHRSRHQHAVPGSGQPQEAPGTNAKVVADDRTNSVLISGEKSQRLRYKTLITHLDTPLEAGGDTQVRYLNYADAEAHRRQAQGASSRHHCCSRRRARRSRRLLAPAAAADRSTTIWADPQTNALVDHCAAKDHATDHVGRGSS